MIFLFKRWLGGGKVDGFNHLYVILGRTEMTADSVTVVAKNNIFFFLPISSDFVLSCFSCIWLFVTLWTVAHQAPLSIGFSRQEYWGGLPFLLQGPSWPRIEPASPMSPAFAVRFFTANTTWESHLVTLVRHKQRYWANCIPWLWSNNSHASCQVTLGRTFFIKEQYDGFQLLLHLGEWQLHRLKSNYW